MQLEKFETLMLESTLLLEQTVRQNRARYRLCRQIGMTMTVAVRYASDPSRLPKRQR